jgi:hypothetical protein
MKPTSFTAAVSVAVLLLVGAEGAAGAPRPPGPAAPPGKASARAAAPVASDRPPLPPTAQVIDHLNDLFRASSSEARMSMKIVTDRYRRDLELQSWTRGKGEALIVVREPAREAGTATLRAEEGLWSYAPRADRLVRIPSSLLSDSWMGSHFTNDDLIRETDYARDYDAALAWNDQEGRLLLQAILRPRPEAPVVWSRIVYLLEPDDYLPVRADYFDGARIARTLTFSDPHQVSGRRVPFRLQMKPAGKPGESTLIEYQDVRFDVKVDPALFTQRGLRRGISR